MKLRALLSVTDKTGLADFGRGLSEFGFELVSTGGTAKHLREAGLEVIDVSEITNFPEMLDGRVKTLHPLIHGGILGRRGDPSHTAQMAEHGIQPVALVCVNLYAFEKTVSGPHSFEEAVESIDIGGPSMIRAAAKNSEDVLVVVDPADYPKVLEAIASENTDELRKPLMAKAFRHTAYYDSMIARYLSGDDLTETLTMGYRRQQELRYGENPHQTAGLYVDPLSKGGVSQGRMVWGKELSYNNLLDADAAWELVCDMPANSCAIIKHGNPCGAAVGDDNYRTARSSDTVSAFGGIAAFNGPISAEEAEAMTEKGNFLEVVIGTSFSTEALEMFQNRSGWGQSVRLLECELSGASKRLTFRSIRGGTLVQDADEEPESAWTVPTKRHPTDDEMEALKLMWSVIPHVKSNAIIIGSKNQLLGVGAGQSNRVQSVRLAIDQAGEKCAGAVLASDAFFPFPDSIETAAAAGIKAFIQPGGSKKDQDSIDAADRLGIAMVLTGVRHFRH